MGLMEGGNAFFPKDAEETQSQLNSLVTFVAFFCLFVFCLFFFLDHNLPKTSEESACNVRRVELSFTIEKK